MSYLVYTTNFMCLIIVCSRFSSIVDCIALSWIAGSHYVNCKVLDVCLTCCCTRSWMGGVKYMTLNISGGVLVLVVVLGLQTLLHSRMHCAGEME